jgi:hypothetical protein
MRVRGARLSIGTFITAASTTAAAERPAERRLLKEGIVEEVLGKAKTL